MPMKRIIILGFVLMHVWLTYLNMSLLKAEKRVAYLEGRQSVFNDMIELPPSSSCFAKDGKC